MGAGEQGQEGPGLFGLSKGRTIALLVGLGFGGSSEVPLLEETPVPEALGKSLQLHLTPAFEGWRLAAHLTSCARSNGGEPSSSRPSCTHVCSPLELSYHEAEAGRSPLGATAR